MKFLRIGKKHKKNKTIVIEDGVVNTDEMCIITVPRNKQAVILYAKKRDLAGPHVCKHKQKRDFNVMEEILLNRADRILESSKPKVLTRSERYDSFQKAFDRINRKTEKALRHGDTSMPSQDNSPSRFDKNISRMSNTSDSYMTFNIDETFNPLFPSTMIGMVDPTASFGPLSPDSTELRESFGAPQFHSTKRDESFGPLSPDSMEGYESFGPLSPDSMEMSGSFGTPASNSTERNESYQYPSSHCSQLNANVGPSSCDGTIINESYRHPSPSPASSPSRKGIGNYGASGSFYDKTKSDIPEESVWNLSDSLTLDKSGHHYSSPSGGTTIADESSEYVLPRAKQARVRVPKSRRPEYDYSLAYIEPPSCLLANVDESSEYVLPPAKQARRQIPKSRRPEYDYSLAYIEPPSCLIESVDEPLQQEYDESIYLQVPNSCQQQPQQEEYEESMYFQPPTSYQPQPQQEYEESMYLQPPTSNQPQQQDNFNQATQYIEYDSKYRESTRQHSTDWPDFNPDVSNYDYSRSLPNEDNEPPEWKFDKQVSPVKTYTIMPPDNRRFQQTKSLDFNKNPESDQYTHYYFNEEDYQDRINKFGDRIIEPVNDHYFDNYFRARAKCDSPKIPKATSINDDARIMSMADNISGASYQQNGSCAGRERVNPQNFQSMVGNSGGASCQQNGSRASDRERVESRHSFQSMVDNSVDVSYQQNGSCASGGERLHQTSGNKRRSPSPEQNQHSPRQNSGERGYYRRSPSPEQNQHSRSSERGSNKFASPNDRQNNSSENETSHFSPLCTGVTKNKYHFDIPKEWFSDSTNNTTGKSSPSNNTTGQFSPLCTGVTKNKYHFDIPKEWFSDSDNNTTGNSSRQVDNSNACGGNKSEDEDLMQHFDVSALLGTNYTTGELRGNSTSAPPKNKNYYSLLEETLDPTGNSLRIDTKNRESNSFVREHELVNIYSEPL